MINKPAISVQNISKRFFLDKDKKRIGFSEILRLPSMLFKGGLFNKSDNEIWALKNISFDLERGQRLGIIGRNGAGKTTLLKILSRLIYPTEGKAIIRGRTTSLFGVGTGFKPKLTGRENVYHNAALHGLTKDEINGIFDEIVAFSGIERFIDTPVQYYSKGMYTRLAFSVAAHLDPEILMLDEILSGGDMAFQKKCLNKIEGIASSGRTVLFVSHNMNAVINLCDKCMWIEGGQIIESGMPKDVVESYSKRMLKLQSSYNVTNDKEVQNDSSAIDDVDDNRDEPGASLISFEVLDKHGYNKELFRRDEAISIQVVYKVLRDDISIVPVIHLFRKSEHAFSSHPDEITHVSKGSICKASTIIPGMLLNTGEYDLSVAIVTPGRPKWRHVYLENVLSIKVVPEHTNDNIFSGEYRGAVRPDIPWVSETIK